MSAAQDLLSLALTRPATLGEGRLICLDGPAGSGKTTLAAELTDLASAQVVHLDDLYEGWGGLTRLTDQLDTLLLPLASGEAGTYRRYDWQAGRFAETVTVPPAPILVLEGVGSGSAAYASLCTVLAWLDAPYRVRMRRALDRDGNAFAPHWEAWAAAEQQLFARERTAERADVII